MSLEKSKAKIEKEMPENGLSLPVSSNFLKKFEHEVP